ncbi:MAG: hypothetical protein IJC70_00215 [Firmicutes bacterium]|nr:hypothetical protein [Bacillota bacterium]
MDEQTCQNCKYFYQHYTLTGRRLLRIYCGHCGRRRAARKRPDAAACADFVPAAADADIFVSREYLSKELLRYMMDMELFPGIDDGYPKKK